MNVSEHVKVEHVSKRFGEVVAIDDLSLQLFPGEVLGLVGPNGAGKTTLFNLVSGILVPDSGSICICGRNVTGLPPYRVARIGVGRMFQELRLIRQISVLENVMLAFPRQPGENLSGVAFRWRSVIRTEKENRRRAEEILNEVGLLHELHAEAEALSYGQQKLLCIACLIASGAGLLLMDEPIAGIAPEMASTILLIIEELSKRGTSTILIDHDLDAVSSVCKRIAFLDAGRKRAEGTPDEIRNNPDVIEAYLE